MSLVSPQLPGNRTSAHLAGGGIGVRPKIAVLWEGQPLEELGIFESLIEAAFTITVGRTKPSKRFAAGKPKVGGAELKFSLQDRSIARKLAQLLHQKARPTVALGFGYEGSQGYWIGAFSAGSNKDPEIVKKYKQIATWKIDKIDWDYSSGAMPTLSIKGLTDKVLGLNEKVKPRIYTDETLKNIFKGIADEHGLILDIDPSLPADQRVASAMKSVRESDWEFVAKWAQRMGGASMYLDVAQGRGGYGASGVSAQFSVNGDRGLANSARYIDTVRNVLRIAALPGFMDLQGLEQQRPIVLGFGARLTLAQKQRCDYLVQSVKVTEDGYKTGANPAAAKIDKENQGKMHGVILATAQGGRAGETVLVNFRTGKFLDNRARDLAATTGQRADALRTRSEGDVPGTNQYHAVASPLPDEVDGGRFTSAELSAIALSTGFSFTVQVEMSPGVPWLQPPASVELMGTDAHDGLYGVETTGIKFSGSAFTTSHTLRPLSVGSGGGSGGSGANKAANNPELNPEVPMSGGTKENPITVTQILGKKFLEQREIKAKRFEAARPKEEPVPAKP